VAGLIAVVILWIPPLVLLKVTEKVDTRSSRESESIYGMGFFCLGCVVVRLMEEEQVGGCRYKKAHEILFFPR
jgi:hypothetical protein